MRQPLLHPEFWRRSSAAGVAAFFLIIGTRMFVSPDAYFAPLPPGADHFVRDTAALYVGLGLAAGTAAVLRPLRAATMTALGIVLATVALSHVFDRADGRTADLVPLLVLLVLSVAAGTPHSRTSPAADDGHGDAIRP